MLLHSGAGFHRHEFSPENSSHNVEPPRRLQLTRSAFSSPPPTQRNSTPARPTPILQSPGRSLSTSKLQHVRFQDPTVAPIPDLKARRRTVDTMGNILPMVESSATDSLSISTTSADEEVNSIPQSQPMLKFILSPTIIGRSSTFKQAPRHMMQLRLVHKDGDIPIVDVHEMPLISRNQLKAGDLRFSKYGSDEVEAFFRAKSSEIRIVEKGIQKGAVWTATVHSPNLYEFISTDTSDPRRTITTTARWRSTRYKLNAPVKKSEIKLAFSIIHAHTNQHPILAYLKDGVLRTKHDYIATSSSRPATIIESKREGPEPVEIKPMAIEIDNNTKTLIAITAMWVGLQQELTPSLVRPCALDNTHGRTVSQATLDTKENNRPLTPPVTDPRIEAITSFTPPCNGPQVTQRTICKRDNSGEQINGVANEKKASDGDDPPSKSRWKRFTSCFRKKGNKSES